MNQLPDVKFTPMRAFMAFGLALAAADLPGDVVIEVPAATWLQVLAELRRQMNAMPGDGLGGEKEVLKFNSPKGTITVRKNETLSDKLPVIASSGGNVIQ